MSLTKKEKTELKSLEKKCFAKSGTPLATAATDDLIKVAKLRDKQDKELSAKTIAEKPTPKTEPPKVDTSASVLVAEGYEYLGKDDRGAYFTRGGHAYQLTSKGLEQVGYRFSPKLLARIKK